MVILSPCWLFTNKGRPPNTEHPTNNGKLEQPTYARFTPAFPNGETQIVIAVGNVKHRLDTADVFGLTRSLSKIYYKAYY